AGALSRLRADARRVRAPRPDRCRAGRGPSGRRAGRGRQLRRHEGRPAAPERPSLRLPPAALADLWQPRAVSAEAATGPSPARSALLASLAPPEFYGRAFGFERALDHAGAVVGPLAAAALVATVGIRPTLYVAVVPGLFAAVAIVFAAREAAGRAEPVRRRMR